MMRLVALVSAMLAPLPAQNVSCALSGTVRDPHGAAMATVEVLVTSRDNGFIRRVTTNREGFFSIPDLTPATFSVTITAAGFKKYTQSGIEINSGEERALGEI